MLTYSRVNLGQKKKFLETLGFTSLRKWNPMERKWKKKRSDYQRRGEWLWEKKKFFLIWHLATCEYEINQTRPQPTEHALLEYNLCTVSQYPVTLASHRLTAIEICVLQWLEGDKRRQGKPNNAWTRLRLGSLTGTCCIHRIIRLFCAGEQCINQIARSMFWGVLDWTVCLLALSSQAGSSPNFRSSFESLRSEEPWCLGPSPTITMMPAMVVRAS